MSKINEHVNESNRSRDNNEIHDRKTNLMTIVKMLSMYTDMLMHLMGILTSLQWIRRRGYTPYLISRAIKTDRWESDPKTGRDCHEGIVWVEYRILIKDAANMLSYTVAQVDEWLNKNKEGWLAAYDRILSDARYALLKFDLIKDILDLNDDNEKTGIDRAGADGR